MFQGVKGSNTAAQQAISSGGTNAGSVGAGAPGTQKDLTEAQTAPKFGEIWQQIESKYGAKPDKPREIKKTLGKDDFLKIMVTQMKNQDPTNPFKADQMAAQMAQFASVEQLENLNRKVANLSNQNLPLEKLAMTSMIGKTIQVDRDRFPHTEGQVDSLSFVLPKDAKKVKVAVIAENGETMLEKDLGPQKAGPNSFSWDGIRSNTLPSKTGNYMFRVDAADDSGVSLPIQTQGMARVIGISFEGSEPVFLVGDAHHQDKVALRNVVKIEDMGSAAPGMAIPGAQPLGGAPQASQPMQPAQPNFFSFQKGVGSNTIDPAKAQPALAQALARFRQQEEQAEAAHAAPKREVAQAAPAAPEEKGFPNGLHDDDNLKPKGGEQR